MLRDVPAADLRKAREILTGQVHGSELEVLCRAVKVLFISAIDAELEEKPGVHARPKSADK